MTVGGHRRRPQRFRRAGRHRGISQGFETAARRIRSAEVGARCGRSATRKKRRSRAEVRRLTEWAFAVIDLGSPCPDYWDLTLRELKALRKAHNDRERRTARHVANVMSCITGISPEKFLTREDDENDEDETPEEKAAREVEEMRREHQAIAAEFRRRAQSQQPANDGSKAFFSFCKARGLAQEVPLGTLDAEGTS